MAWQTQPTSCNPHLNILKQHILYKTVTEKYQSGTKQLLLQFADYDMQFQKRINNHPAPSLQAYTGNIIWHMSYSHKDELDNKQMITTSHYMKWKEAINAH